MFLGSVLGSKWFKTIVTCGVAFYFENMFENDYRTVKARNKTCAWVGFDFGNENQITCTRSNQHAFGNVLLAYENGLLLCLEKVLGTNRIKLGLVGKRWCELLFLLS